VRLSELRGLDEVVEAQRADEDFRVVWDRTAIARDVANLVIRYRTEHRLSQRALARIVGLAQPAIARLESGEHQPSLDTLVKLTARTGLEFHIDVVNGGVELASA